jgi:hypothetical protein
LSTISQKKKGPKKKNHHNNYLLDAYDDLNLKASAVKCHSQRGAVFQSSHTTLAA